MDDLALEVQVFEREPEPLASAHTRARPEDGQGAKAFGMGRDDRLYGLVGPHGDLLVLPLGALNGFGAHWVLDEQVVFDREAEDRVHDEVDALSGGQPSCWFFSSVMRLLTSLGRMEPTSRFPKCGLMWSR